jgi:hypothetical protein
VQVCVEYEGGVEGFISKLTEEVKKSKMEVDGAKEHSVSLRDVATRIFEERYAAIEQEQDKYHAKPLQQFREVYPRYYNDSITTIETQLLIARKVVGKPSLHEFRECALRCLTRIVGTDDLFALSHSTCKFAYLTCERARQLVYSRLPKTCMERVIGLAKKSAKDREHHVGLCIGYFKALKNLLRKVKDTQTVSVQGNCEIMRDLLTSPTQTPFLLQLLEQVTDIQVVVTEDSPALSFSDHEVFSPVLLASHAFQY